MSHFNLITFIRFIASEHHTYIIAVILSLGEIMPIYSRYVLKELVCVIIITPFNYQPSSYSKYIKLNMYLSCNIKLVSNIKYIYFMRLCNL